MVQDKPKGTRLTIDIGVECFTKGFAGTQGAFDKAVAALKKIDGVLDSSHAVKEETDPAQYALEVVFDPKKAPDLEKLAETATVENENKKLIPGRVRVALEGTLSKREETWLFEEPAGIKPRISFETEEIAAAVAKIVGDGEVAGTLKGVIDQVKAFEPADPKRKALVTRIVVSGFEKAK